MKLQITEKDLETLNDLTWDTRTELGDRLLLSKPYKTGEWVLHDSTIELFREMVRNLEDQKLFEEMESQTIHGTLNLNLGDILK